MDKAEIKLIDWSTVGGVTWRTYVATQDARWRCWRRPWLAAVECAPNLDAVWLMEAPCYPWHVEEAA